MTLAEIKGPICPNCECRDSQVIERGTRFKSNFDRRRCRHCGRVWREQRPTNGDADKPARPVAYATTACPKCGSKQTRVTSTRKPIRHHKCDGCGTAFKSFEG